MSEPNSSDWVVKFIAFSIGVLILSAAYTVLGIGYKSFNCL